MGKKYKSVDIIAESDLEGDSPSASQQTKSKTKSSQPKSSQTKPEKREAPATPEKSLKRSKIDKTLPKSSKAVSKPKSPTPRARSRSSSSEEETSKKQAAESSESEDVESSSDSETSTQSASSESEVEQRSSKERAKPNGTPRVNGQRHSQSKQPSAAPVQPYEPPLGFEKVHFERQPQALQELSGKKLLHITCPAAISLDEVTDLTQRQLQNGARLQHNGLVYFFKGQFGSNAEARLLIPTSNGLYEAHQKSFDRSLIFQEDTPIEKEASASQEPVTKPVVPQPDGLRSRNFPPGFEPQPAIQPRKSKQFKAPPSSVKQITQRNDDSKYFSESAASGDESQAKAGASVKKDSRVSKGKVDGTITTPGKRIPKHNTSSASSPTKSMSEANSDSESSSTSNESGESASDSDSGSGSGSGSDSSSEASKSHVPETNTKRNPPQTNGKRRKKADSDLTQSSVDEKDPSAQTSQKPGQRKVNGTSKTETRFTSPPMSVPSKSASSKPREVSISESSDDESDDSQYLSRVGKPQKSLGERAMARK